MFRNKDIIIRQMEPKDINFILELEYINFTLDIDSVLDEYKNLITDKNKFCVIAETKQGESLGFIQYSIFDKELLIEKYPNGLSYLSNLNGNILYLNELIVKKEFQNIGVAFKLLQHALKEGKLKKCEMALAFAVEDGVNKHVNAKKLLENSKFNKIENIPNMWNQSTKVNCCPVCLNYNDICKCSAIIYAKKYK